jgi:hypothetical protein
MHKKNLLLPVMFIFAGIFYVPDSVARAEFSYESGGEVYRYAVVQSGDYYNFEFDKDPGMMLEQYKAGVHVLRSVYNDTSTELENRQNYIRERARSLSENKHFKIQLVAIERNY